MNLNADGVEKILKQRKEDLELQRKNILINNGLLIHDNINIDKLPRISNKISDEYGLDVKFLNLIGGLCITNELICNSNLLFNKIKINDKEINIFNGYFFTKLQKLNEYIIYDLKKYIDEIISITWLLKQENYVEDININSIGAYLKNIKKGNYNEYDKFIDFFEKLNDIDNAYKHSYTNSAVAPNVGIEKNYIVVYYSKYGKKIKKPKIVYVELDNLINMFNEFYYYSFNIVEKLGNK